MTLDEAIKHCEEVADGFDETAQEIAMQDENGVYQPRVSWYQDRASSQRQLAEWLRELKTYREADKYKWNNHQVACLLADIFGDTCACNYNGNDEWLPFKCELLDVCPNTVGVACWEQYLKHMEVNADDD